MLKAIAISVYEAIAKALKLDLGSRVLLIERINYGVIRLRGNRMELVFEN
ncbi:hypothetical protein [Pleurocapsa sp. PCC 7319]|nr:hypothetical protein [Pleurocapsa sp. PCC 7319]